MERNSKKTGSSVSSSAPSSMPILWLKSPNDVTLMSDFVDCDRLNFLKALWLTVLLFETVESCLANPPRGFGLPSSPANLTPDRYPPGAPLVLLSMLVVDMFLRKVGRLDFASCGSEVPRKADAISAGDRLAAAPLEAAAMRPTSPLRSASRRRRMRAFVSSDVKDDAKSAHSVAVAKQMAIASSRRLSTSGFGALDFLKESFGPPFCTRPKYLKAFIAAA
mmetsp:Transcript_69302/g.122673  ORF Transcript_69302/g.122673 Transcript_69302/m.122673 type:complete len:221 (-) Transcript_69302:574-1236(-)